MTCLAWQYNAIKLMLQYMVAQCSSGELTTLVLKCIHFICRSRFNTFVVFHIERTLTNFPQLFQIYLKIWLANISILVVIPRD
jgi:hypothetical protein